MLLLLARKHGRRQNICAATFGVLLTAAVARPAGAVELFVAPGGTGPGTASAPFGRIQDGINAAQPGDTVTIAAGTYMEALRTTRNGSSTARIVIRAAGSRGTVVVSVSGRVLTVSHGYVTIEGLVFDGRYGADDIVRLGSGASGVTMRNVEVRRSSRDGIDMAAPSDVLIEGSLIHRTLNAMNGRTDAHGIVAGAVQRLTIRNTEIHTFSGDAIQVDPGRSAPGWNDVVIDGCKLWLAPLATSENGFAAGTVPGENAVDTKSDSSLPRARITIRNTEAWGYRNGLIGNMAAFNLKENIDALVDRVTLRNSEIAFRMRGPSSVHPAGAWVRVQNAVVHSSGTAFRYEDNLQNARIWNATIGGGVSRVFYAAASSGSVLDVRNLLALGSSLPKEASGASNLAVPASAFADAGAHNYQLAVTSPAIDAGVTIPDVTSDRQNTPRPQGRAYDIGAYERLATTTDISPDIVLYAWKAPVIVGKWYIARARSAADGMLMTTDDEGMNYSARAAPANYFELTFRADAGRPYRLWLRGRARGNDLTNDSVFVQFSDSLSAAGAAVYRIGSTSAAIVVLADCGTCTVSAWGWQDNGFGVNVLGPVIYFATTGTHTLRIQPREDGLSIDQIVLSSSAYLTASPGALKNDGTVLPETID